LLLKNGESGGFLVPKNVESTMFLLPKNNMKYRKRLIDKHLTDWKNEPDTKPLLLRQARQAGKASVINKGSIAEQFWGLEYLKYCPPFAQTDLFYWHREAPGANAEVDFVVQRGAEILPIEVKSSGKGGMQSLRQFLTEKKNPFGFRFSLENYSAYENIKTMPLYAVSNFLKM
jgi:hypothetical protein